MLWLGTVCIVLAVIIVILLIKIAILHRAADEIRQGMAERLEQDTNTLISISTNDRTMCKLADNINKELRLLRKERRRFQSGDRELKEAITNISHDLRTPLTAVCGYLDLLEKEEKSEAAARYLSLIENRTQALKQLTEELFRYSVITSAPGNIRLEAVSLNGVLEESVAAYYAALKGRGITPTIKMPEKRIVRRLDRAAISRVFGNILNNALKYSDGDLDITLSETGKIIFTNTASVLDEVQVGKLFNRFYMIEAARNSTGLGLAISRTLVEQMKGEITARYGDKKLSICILFPEDAPNQTKTPYEKC
jgi:signal transduction histidine kinase